jgi:hypothetical protein
MSAGKREGNRPERRFAAAGTYSQEELLALSRRIRYGGMAHHKRRPGDYGFVPPVNPRPSKSMCDDLRPIRLAEASALFSVGIHLGLISPFLPEGVPKYVWAVDEYGEPYEAKVGGDGSEHHGYRINENEARMREYILKEWECRRRT